MRNQPTSTAGQGEHHSQSVGRLVGGLVEEAPSSDLIGGQYLEEEVGSGRDQSVDILVWGRAQHLDEDPVMHLGRSSRLSPPVMAARPIW